MNASRRAALLAMVLSSAAVGETSPAATQLIVQMRAEIQAEMKSARENDRSIERLWQLSSLLLQIERTLADGGSGSDYDWNQTVAALQGYAVSERLQQLAQALASEATREFAARDKAVVAELEGFIEANVGPVLDAKTTAELDAPLAALQKAQQSAEYRRQSRQTQGAYQRLQGAVEFVKLWQDYLAAIEAGRTDQARSALSNLSNSGRQYSFIPRSKLLALINNLDASKKTDRPSSGVQATVREQGSQTWRPVEGAVTVTSGSPPSLIDLLQQIKTLDELVAARPQLDYSRARSSEESTLVSAAVSMADSYSRIMRGQITAWRITSTDALYSPKLSHLWEQFFAFALPRVLSIDAAAAVPKPGENIADCLKRILADARKAQDWSLASRVIATGRTLNIYDSLAATKDIAALTHFTTALIQQRAKQYAMAVLSFESALKAGSEIVPPELIGEHLERIRKEQPDEYRQGIQAALSAAVQPPVERTATPSITNDPTGRTVIPDPRAKPPE